MSKQLVFPWPMNVTKIYPDGRRERLRYGKYEAVMIDSENGHPVDRCKKILTPPRSPVTEVECADKTRLVFDEPFYLTNEPNDLT